MNPTLMQSVTLRGLVDSIKKIYQPEQGELNTVIGQWILEYCERSAGDPRVVESVSREVYMPFKKALHFCFERMLDESLALVQPDKTWLHLRDWAAKKLAASEEIKMYLSSYAMHSPGMDLIDCGDGNMLPNHLYGFKVYVPKTPAVKSSGEPGSMPPIIHRVVPAAYLYYCPSANATEAWYMPVEYVF